jgi:tRNA(Ile)-lysidine synthase
MQAIDRVGFMEFLQHECGVEPHHRLLVAVSGGADSMALQHLLMSSFCDIRVAHVNFRLRGLESDGDELMVVDYCREHGIAFDVNAFDTTDYAQQNGLSVEMAARELRYGWFQELAQLYQCQWIATGHHLDDSIETFFLNLARGTGLHGLTGIKPQTGNIVRPLLAYRHPQIEAYCRQYQIPWRTDSSNQETLYLRNRVRHDIVPQFEQLNTSFVSTMQQNMIRLSQMELFVNDEVARLREQLVTECDGSMLIPIKLIENHPHCKLLLYEWLSPLGFNATHIADIVASLKGIPGKQFVSSTHRLVRDRSNLVIVSLEEKDLSVLYIDISQTVINEPIALEWRQFDRDEHFTFSQASNLVHFDADLVDFPLTLRRWQTGDQFRPLGMTNFKKLSDFFVDQKLSIIEKEQVWLLLSGDDIVWVINHRIDDRFKVTNKTKRILEVKI